MPTWDLSPESSSATRSPTPHFPPSTFHFALNPQVESLTPKPEIVNANNLDPTPLTASPSRTSYLHPKPHTPEPETRNPKPETRNPKPEA